MIDQSRRHSLETAKFFLFILVMCSGPTLYFTNELLVAQTFPNTIDFPLERAKAAKQQQHHDFAYDRERWERHSPRFVLLAGPHKTASSTLQSFFSDIAHSTVSVSNTNVTKLRTFVTPHPAVTDWVWPVPVEGDCFYKNISSSERESFFLKSGSSRKFYATMGALFSGRYARRDFKNWYSIRGGIPKADLETRKAEVVHYFRSLFRKPWEEGKNIVIGSEEFDAVVAPLRDGPVVGVGEELHVASSSAGMLDNLLDLLPWDSSSSDGNGTTNGNARSPPLQLEDIEVQINLRTPRISHVISIWHQQGHKKSLQKFLLDQNAGFFLYQINSLGEALQYARRGIQTTVIDMAGVREKELREGELSTEQTNRVEGNEPIGGLEGIVACDILRLGKNNGNGKNNATAFCDDYSRLHLPGYVNEPKEHNKKNDKQSQDMTEEQLEEIERILNKLDCSIWKYLKKYQASGTLRILYPSKNLFATCDPEGIDDKDVSFLESLWNMKSVAREGLGLWHPQFWNGPELAGA
mmetsp:Transcript_35004/g.68922  ORF Transcript_35004/g.68922 Transcript_35004/m.68922 type:complete len:523 (-) Transcript_35004:52-1620(-)|eukprot:CAMPEP_0194318024 /NCGR_PEP_ID=MMETSP0171-20130528/14673_1 /TAXON_ID=218684 /ORGANISM="Corethron pennatum, Strain L29A3" /LENGTH=522 /DNA_ID=CAMNT_0039074793 /DNA_START=142 /DNA_END=1710 /DNA_ORIENTATION=-